MAAAPEIETSEYFFRIGRDAAIEKLKELKRPIARTSSIPNKYAITYYNKDGDIVHSLFGAYRILTRRGNIDIIYMGEGDNVIRFESPKEFIDFIRSINHGAYEDPGSPAANSPRLVANSDDPTMGGLRRLRRNRRTTRRRTTRRRTTRRRTTRRNL
jgi:hypothetical protein